MRDSSWRKQKRRKKDYSKASRKRSICRQVYINSDWYDNLHQYSKNKIHCSCGMCRFRNTWEPDRKPISDVKKIERMKYRIFEFYNGLEG